MNVNMLSPERVDAIIARSMDQLPEGHTGGFVIDVDKNEAIIAAELVKSGDTWTLRGEAAAEFKYHPQQGESPLSVGTKLLFSWK